ncbi:MAG TPA: alpha-galactosidase [Candidatus Limnocylindrales bacterium]|nr:alpha-galactosidase [Candidatus Limnocylindrales bacterium]
MSLIEWRPDDRQLHLTNGRLSLILAVHEDGSLGPVHLGAPLATGRAYGHLVPRGWTGFSNRLAEPIALEVPTPGSGDYRVPALEVVQADGASVLQLRYREHRIRAGKPSLDGLPSTYVEADDEAETVEIDLADEPSGVVVTVAWTIFRDRAVLARSIRIRNDGRAAVRLETAMSLSLDLPDAAWTLVHLAGAWARERHVVERALVPGRQSISSVRGSSSAAHNPFIGLRREWTTEAAGEALGAALAYSGNFLAEVEVEAYGTARLRMGINPETFAWTLEPGAAFQTPEAVVVWTADGLGAMSDAFHSVFRERLARGVWRDRARPILVNNWEGTYFDFDEERLVAIATVARDLGIELFVLDDGWFGRRDDDTTSLGDWFVDRRKLPNGIDGLSRRIAELGLGFGIWIEPEMVSERSELFAAHPDWAFQVPGRPRTEGRQQLVLDLGRPEVVDHLAGVLGDLLASGPISYVKWDMNRWLTEPWSGALPADRQGEALHRHILGVYELYRRLTTRFPDVLFESCASGGDRFDAGMLAFAPQAWTSDDTDAIERLRIQWGSSLAYPQSSMGAHVSAVPNHQTGRVTPLATRAAVAFFGAFGYELDTAALSADDQAAIRDQVAFFKAHRGLFQFGRFVRLRSPFAGDGNETAWMVVAADRRRAIVAVYRVLNRPNPRVDRLPLRGLDETLDYRITAWPPGLDGVSATNEITRRGDDLQANGLLFDVERHVSPEIGDFSARLFVLEAG